MYNLSKNKAIKSSKILYEFLTVDDETEFQKLKNVKFYS